MSALERGEPVLVQPVSGNPFIAFVVNLLEDGWIMVRAADDDTTLSYPADQVARLGDRVREVLENGSAEDAEAFANDLALGIREHPGGTA